MPQNKDDIILSHFGNETNVITHFFKMVEGSADVSVIRRENHLPEIAISGSKEDIMTAIDSSIALLIQVKTKLTVPPDLTVNEDILKYINDLLPKLTWSNYV